MPGRPPKFQEHEMLEKAIDLFWEKGYEATSLDDLLLCMDLNKGSLYHFFGSKKELFSRALDLFGERSSKAIEQKIRSAKEPVEGIKKFFLELANAENHQHLKGCFMGNSIAELSSVDNHLKDKAIANLKTLEDLFCQYIDEAKRLKKLQTKDDSRTISRYLLNLWNGINITRRIYPSAKVLKPLIEMQLSILK